MPDDPARDAERRVSELFAEHHAPILAYAMRRAPSAEDAEDAAAETFVVAWRRMADIPDDPLPWLYGIARRLLANQRRSAVRRLALHLRLSRPEPTTVERLGEPTGPATAALKRLREEDRELLRLVAWEGLGHRAIGQVLGISENAVAIRLHRARRRFAALLAEDGGVKGPDGSRTSRWQKDSP